MNFEESGMMWSWPIQGTILAFCPEELRKVTEIFQNSQCPAKFRTEYLPNVRQELGRYINPFGIYLYSSFGYTLSRSKGSHMELTSRPGWLMTCLLCFPTNLILLFVDELRFISS
jgi:hypothetical protein